MLALESADSIRSLYRHFLSGITLKSLNAFYYACSYAKTDFSVFMNVTSRLALRLIPDSLQSQPVFLCIDDTMVSKFGTKFEDVSKLFDHAAHNGSNYLNSIVDEYPNLDLIGNARSDSVIYDLAPAPTGKRGRPAKHGRRLSIAADFTLSAEKVGGYYTGCRRVLTNIFGTKEVLAYVTSPSRESKTRRLFFSTVFPSQLQFFCAWQEKAPLNQTGSSLPSAWRLIMLIPISSISSQLPCFGV